MARGASPMGRPNAVRMLLLLVLAAGCAGIPPAKPISDMEEIAGRWEGNLVLKAPERGLLFAGATWVLNRDGTFAMTSPWGTARGTFRIVDGRIHFPSRGSTFSGIAGVREGGGGRMLLSWHDDDVASGEWTPAR